MQKQEDERQAKLQKQEDERQAKLQKQEDERQAKLQKQEDKRQEDLERKAAERKKDEDSQTGGAKEEEDIPLAFAVPPPNIAGSEDYQEGVPLQQSSTPEAYKLGDYDLTDEDTIISDINLRLAYFEQLKNNSVKSRDAVKQLVHYFSSKKKTDNKDLKEFRRLLEEAVEISENEVRCIRKLHGFVEQEKRMMEILPFTKISDNLQRLLPATDANTIKRKNKGRINWLIRRAMTGIYAPNDIITSGIDEAVKSKKAYRPVIKKDKVAEQESEEPQQKGGSNKMIRKMDITDEQLEAFENYHNRNEELATPFAEEKIVSERNIFNIINKIQQLLLRAFPESEMTDYSELEIEQTATEVWTNISENIKSFNRGFRLDDTLINSTITGALCSKIIYEGTDKQQKELSAVLSSDAEKIKERNEVLQKLRKESVVERFWGVQWRM